MKTKIEIKALNTIPETETRTVESVRKDICEAVEPTEDIQNFKPSILVVEDDKICTKLLVTTLRRYSVDVDCVHDGEEALNSIADDISKYSMVITDVRMPIMDGRILITKLRQLAYNKPIIVITGDVLSEDIQAVISLGANEVLAKPVKPQALCELLIRHEIIAAVEK